MEHRILLFYPCDSCGEIHESTAVFTQDVLEDVHKYAKIDLKGEMKQELIQYTKKGFYEKHLFKGAIFDEEAMILVEDMALLKGK